MTPSTNISLISCPDDLQKKIFNYLGLSDEINFSLTCRAGRDFKRENENKITEFILSQPYETLMRGVSLDVIENIRHCVVDQTLSPSYRVKIAFEESLCSLFRTFHIGAPREGLIQVSHQGVDENELSVQLKSVRSVYTPIRWELFKPFYFLIEGRNAESRRRVKEMERLDIDFEPWIEERKDQPKIGERGGMIPIGTLNLIPLSSTQLNGEMLALLFPHLSQLGDFEKMEAIFQAPRFRHPLNEDFARNAFNEAFSLASIEGDLESLQFLTKTEEKVRWIDPADFRVGVIHIAEGGYGDCLDECTNTPQKLEMITDDCFGYLFEKAIDAGSRECLEVLSVNSPDRFWDIEFENYWKAFSDVAKFKTLNCLDWFIATPEQLARIPDEVYGRAVMLALQQGNYESLELLVNTQEKIEKIPSEVLARAIDVARVQGNPCLNLLVRE